MCAIELIIHMVFVIIIVCVFVGQVALPMIGMELFGKRYKEGDGYDAVILMLRLEDSLKSRAAAM